MNVILCGHGRMGAMVEEQLALQPDVQLLGVVDVDLFTHPSEVPGRADVLIDFSHPDNLDMLLDFARETGCALVLGTTGYAPQQLEQIRVAAERVHIVHSSNYSLGVALLREAVERIAPVLLKAGFDVEIVEAHHGRKADAPSGTAQMLLAAVDPKNERPRVYGREGMTGARGQEIGVHAIRGGTLAGAHSVLFLGEDEVIELRHSAASRRIFATGAIQAARFAAARRATVPEAGGLYDMRDVLKGEF